MHNNRRNGYGAVRPARAHRAAPFKGCEPQPVWLEYDDEQARRVSIIGSFNNWNPASTGMVRGKGGKWLRVLFLPPGRYEYVFMVDGHCVADPGAAERVPNVYGCLNSLLKVPAVPPRNGFARRNTTVVRHIFHSKSAGGSQKGVSPRRPRSRALAPLNQKQIEPNNEMKRTMLSSLAALMLLLAGLALAGCSSDNSHEHGSGDQNQQDIPAHQHSH